MTQEQKEQLQQRFNEYISQIEILEKRQDTLDKICDVAVKYLNSKDYPNDKYMNKVLSILEEQDK